MNISFISMDVESVPTAKGSYQKGIVTYKNLATNKVETKTLMDFNNKDVWHVLEKASKGDTFNVEAEKNEKGYWQWVNIHRQDAPVGQPEPGFKAPRSNYETPEERAQRQVYIVRQSSVASAVELLKDHGKQPNPEEVIKVARQFEAYVFGTGMADIKEDVPF